MKIRVRQKDIERIRVSIERTVRDALKATARQMACPSDTSELRFEAVSEVEDSFVQQELKLIFHEIAAAGLVKFRLSLDDARRLQAGLTASLERYDKLRGASA